MRGHRAERRWHTHRTEEKTVSPFDRKQFLPPAELPVRNARALRFDAGRRAWISAAGAIALSSVVAVAPAKAKPRVIKIVAKKFEFVPGEIRVKQGETVTLQFTAPEVPMGFNLADFKLRADIMPGRPTSVELTPDRAGTFTFLCDVFCGTGHEDMSGSLIVT
jgi:cytochrome c oxidase subunit II